MSLLDIFRGLQVPEPVIEFGLVQLNDFTTKAVLQERGEVEDFCKLPTLHLCPSLHGGLLDYPKLTTQSAGLVTDKWETCLGFVRHGGADTVQEFVESVGESGVKVVEHHAWLVERLVAAGDMEKLAAVCGGLALLRNTLWGFNQQLRPARFTSLYREVCDLVEALSEQMTVNKMRQKQNKTNPIELPRK